MNQRFQPLLYVILMAFATDVFSQLRQPFRFEQEITTSQERFNVISLKAEGLAIVRETEKHEHGKKKWKIEILDTLLTKTWSTEIDLAGHLILVGYESSPGHLYLLFREGESENYNFELVSASFDEKKLQTDHIKFEVNFRMTHFTVAGTSALFGGYVNNEPAVLLYDQSNAHPKVLPGLFITDALLLDVRTNQNQSFNVLLTETKTKERKTLVHRTFDHEGNLLVDDIIEIDPKFTILTGMTSALERDELMIVGTYSDGSTRSATGFYSVVVDPFNNQNVNYIDFGSLSHFLDYLSPKRAERMKARSREQRAQGKIPDYKAYVNPFRIEERSNGFYVLSELYFPSSSFNYTPSAGSYYSPFLYGYPYGASQSTRYMNSPYNTYGGPARNSEVSVSQSVLLVLDANGQPTKDLSLKLEDVKLPSLDQTSDFAIRHDSLFIVYAREGDIFIQKESHDSIQSPQPAKLKVKLQSENDVLKDYDGDIENIRFWFEQNFYLWGYQNIRDETRAGDKTRHVFYINRLTLD